MKKLGTGALLLLTSLSLFSACANVDSEPQQIENVYVIPNTKIVLRDETLPKTSEGRLSACMAKNEGEGMQFLLRFDTDVANVKVTVSDIVNESGEKLDHTLYRQRYIEVSDQRYPSEKGFYPDALVPMFDGSDGKPANDSCDIKAGQNQGFWITVRSTSEQTAGIYEGSAKVTFDGGEREIPIRVEVWDFALPVKSSMQTNFLHHWNNNYYEDVGISSKEMNRMVWEFFLDYRISGNYMFFIEYDGYGADLENYVKSMKEFVDEHPEITHVQLLLHQWDYSGTVNSEAMANNNNNKYMYELMKKYGLTQIASYYVVDEPADTEANEKLIKDLAAGISGFAPDIKNIVTTNNPKYDGYISCWCPLWNMIDKSFVAEKQALGEHVWWYGCAVPAAPYPTYHLNDNLLSPRIVHWMQKDYGVEGELYWGTTLFDYYKGGGNYVTRDVWTNPYTSEGLPGDGYLCYPGKEGDGIVGRNMLIPTLRLEAIRDGMEDYEYLTLAEAKMQKFIEKYSIDADAKELLSTYTQALFRSVGDYEHDSSLLTQQRKLIAEYLLSDDTTLVTTKINADGSNTVTVYSENNITVSANGKDFEKEAKNGYFVYTLTVPKSANTEKITVTVGDKTVERLLGVAECSHELKKVDEVIAECEKSGSCEYYICEKCAGRFYDAAGEERIDNIEDIVEPKLGYHTDDNNDGVCDVCGEKEE